MCPMAGEPLSTLAASPDHALDVRAGPLVLTVESGTIRWVRLGEREVVRGVYAAVRDPDWGTVPPVFTRYEAAASDDAFRLRFTAEHVGDDGIDFAWDGEIQGDDAGTVTFDLEGTARRAFACNRIGFCVLHPASLRGTRLDVESPWGTLRGRFPVQIPAVPPFGEIRRITQHPGGTDEIGIAFEGELFEMEDQRNWTDASFKTFCRPQALPAPYRVEAGERIHQRITISPGRRSRPPRRAPSPGRRDEVAVGAPTTPMPRIGLLAPTSDTDVPAEALRRLARLRFAHLRATVDLAGDPGADVRRLVEQGRELGRPLEVELVGPPDGAGTEAAIAALAAAGHEVARVLVFDAASHVTPRQFARRVRAACASAGLHVPVGGGTRASFWNLNASPLAAEELDVLAFRICPQIHAFDEASILETPEVHADLVATARALAPGLPIAAGPITLRQLVNPDAADGGGAGSPAPSPGQLPDRFDPRQPTAFAATWALATMAALGGAGAEVLTLFETAGWGGLLAARQAGLPEPPLPPGAAYAVLPVLEAVLGGTDEPAPELLPVMAPTGTAAVATATGPGRIRLVLANMGVPARSVRLRIPGAREVNVRALAPGPAGYAWTEPQAQLPSRSGPRVDIGPLGIARVEALVD